MPKQKTIYFTKLKEMRMAQGWQQWQLAAAARVSRPYLHDLENGKRTARQGTWERLAQALQCDVEDIKDIWSDDMTSHTLKPFRYYCPQRPPVPGSIPRGVIRIEYAEDGYMIDAEGHSRKAWGFVEYDRELTAKEIYDYELDPEVRTD